MKKKFVPSHSLATPPSGSWTSNGSLRAKYRGATVSAKARRKPRQAMRFSRQGKSGRFALPPNT